MSLSPDQFRKVNRIKAALGKSDSAVKYHFISLDTFERSAERSKSGRVSTGWPETLAQLRNELQGAHDRVAVLGTGLRAERLLRDALKESAAAVEAWRYGLTSNSVREIDAAISRMEQHWRTADRLGKAGAAALKRGV